MIYKRGEYYHVKFKRGGQVFNKSLKTKDHGNAVEAASQIIAEHDAIRSMPTPLFKIGMVPINTKTAEELSVVASGMFSGMRHRAAKKGLVCTVTRDDLLLLLTASKGVCSVTGVPLDIDTKIDGTRVSPWMPSLDRINSNRGYVKGNLRIVCYLANLAMSQFGEGALELLLHHYAQKKISVSKRKGSGSASHGKR